MRLSDFVNGHARELGFAVGETTTAEPKRDRVTGEEDGVPDGAATLRVTRTVQLAEEGDCLGHGWSHRNILAGVAK